MTQRTLNESHADAVAATARSHGLWQSVNRAIAEVLAMAVRDHHSKAWVCAQLMRVAGPEHRGEPVSVGSLRSAARQIAKGTDRLVLI